MNQEKRSTQIEFSERIVAWCLIGIVLTFVIGLIIKIYVI